MNIKTITKNTNKNLFKKEIKFIRYMFNNFQNIYKYFII